MIARIWHGKTTTSKADDYLRYFQVTGMKDYRATDGNRGVLVFRRDEGQQSDFLILTLWESKDAIIQFAGDDVDKARYYPEDSQYFSELEPNVIHYDVVLNTISGSEK
jgi:heme-degrading monooxygenase HmoA